MAYYSSSGQGYSSSSSNYGSTKYNSKKSSSSKGCGAGCTYCNNCRG